jgi:tRNA(fMet)-specific endonuclease VapC
MPPRFLVDTNILVYLQTKRSASVAQRVLALNPGDAAMSVITFGELFYGLRKSARPEETLQRLRNLTHTVPVLPLPQNAAEAYGHIRSELEASGKMIGNNDLWIAAHARASGLILVTNNEREYRRVRDLKIENWAS